MSDLSKRKVNRVLVMVEHDGDAPGTGDIFDLSALSEEMRVAAKEQYCGGEIELRVLSTAGYESDYKPACFVSWRAGKQYSTSSAAGHLDDAVNAGIRTMPSEKADRIERVQERMRKRMQKLQYDLADERLRQAAAIRHQHPIARVTGHPIAEATTPALTDSNV